MTASNQLPREEYIEQEYFFRTYRERLQDNVPSQDILEIIQEELLHSCQLPMAVDILRTEFMHSGQIAPAMKRMSHYFSSFQTFVVQRSEDDRSRFENISALQILEREARYRVEDVSPAGLFMFQLECISRNRLGYHSGLTAMAGDATYDSSWKRWFQHLMLQLGARDLAELVYLVSERDDPQQSLQTAGAAVARDRLVLFGRQTSRIAQANIGRDPVHFFAALQRQLNYPSVPVAKKPKAERLSPVLESRLMRIEQRVKLLEMENKDGIDLSQFYGKHRTMEEDEDRTN